MEANNEMPMQDLIDYLHHNGPIGNGQRRKLIADVERLARERDEARAACAEKDGTIRMLVNGLHTDALNSPSIQQAVDHTKSLDCGKGWLSPEKRKEIFESLVSVTCDPDNRVCIIGSDADREIIRKSLESLRPEAK